MEAGDIILAINEREVVKLSTKEVLKCLRLSGDIVNIKYKRGWYKVQINNYILLLLLLFIYVYASFLETGTIVNIRCWMMKATTNYAFIHSFYICIVAVVEG